MHLDPSAPVGQLAAEHPLSTRVFDRYHIDFCCGGAVPLAEACAKRGVDAEQILEEIRAVLDLAPRAQKRWDLAPLDELIDHLLTAYHRPLDAELPRLEALARKVLRVHGDKEPEMLGDLLRVFLALKADLEPHMLKEERILFPMIRGGHGGSAQGPIAVMHEEHDGAGEMLRQLREITQDYTLPEQACNSWRALWHGLEALEKETHRHIHLENNVLFPRALAS